MTEVPRPHMVSFSTTGPPYRKKRRSISRPGRNRAAKSTRKNRVTSMWTVMAHTSKIRAIRVARAAPRTPMTGEPRWPKMNTQLRKVFRLMEAMRMYMPSWGFSMLR